MTDFIFRPVLFFVLYFHFLQIIYSLFFLQISTCYIFIIFYWFYISKFYFLFLFFILFKLCFTVQIFFTSEGGLSPGMRSKASSLLVCMDISETTVLVNEQVFMKRKWSVKCHLKRIDFVTINLKKKNKLQNKIS